MEKLLNKRNTVIFVGVLTLWRLYLSATLQLHPDEAYYWLWSRNLDIGYFDHSPAVAYFIWFTTLFSKSELWVRLSATMVSLIVSALTWQLSMQLFRSTVVAAGSVILFNVYPLSMLGLIVISPDIPVFLFQSLSVFIFWQIIRSNNIWLWYALGASFGLSLLSKYTAVLLAPCIFIYLVLTDDRRWLKTVHPYLSLLVGFLCFLPVVYWNSQHDWVSFAFQLRNGLGNEGPSFGKVAEYIGGQLLITGPLIWLIGMYAALVGVYRKDKETLYLIFTSMPIIGFFGITSFRNVAGPNWPLCAYFTFSILATKYCLDGASKIRRSLWFAAVVLSLSISAIVTLHAKFNIIPLERFSKEAAAADATNWFYGWRELATELKKYAGKEIAVTSSHQLSAEIIYYTDSSMLARTDRVARPSEFDLWHWPQILRGRDGVYVWTEGDAIGPYAEYFASTIRGHSLTVYRDARAVRTYNIVLGQNSPAPHLPGSTERP